MITLLKSIFASKLMRNINLKFCFCFLLYLFDFDIRVIVASLSKVRSTSSSSSFWKRLHRIDAILFFLMFGRILQQAIWA